MIRFNILLPARLVIYAMFVGFLAYTLGVDAMAVIIGILSLGMLK